MTQVDQTGVSTFKRQHWQMLWGWGGGRVTKRNEERWKDGFRPKIQALCSGKTVCEFQGLGIQIQYPDSWPCTITSSNTSTARWKKKGFSLGPYCSRITFLQSKERDEGKIRCLSTLKGKKGNGKQWIKCKSKTLQSESKVKSSTISK